MRKKEEHKARPQANSGNLIEGFVFGIHLEGTEQVVTEGIKAFTQAMSKGTAVLPPRTRTATLPSATIRESAATVAVETEEDQPSESNRDVPEPPAIEMELDEPELAETGNGHKRAYNYKPLKFMDDLDLSKASKRVADFMTEKGNPSETNERYIAAAVWLKEYMSVEEITINHIYTVFAQLGWKASIPDNHSQPLRDLKTKRHFLTKEKGQGYKVNWQGLQYVERMGTGK